MDINQLVQKIPRPLLVLGSIVIAIIIFVVQDPLRDECEVQSSLFEKRTRGLLTTKRTRRKEDDRIQTQFPMITYWKDRCKEGNSIGSCADYFDGLRAVTKELKFMKEKCQLSYSQQNESFNTFISHGLHIMALVAWGEKPPAGVADRLGWLTTTHMETFCSLKRTFIIIAGDENLDILKEKVFREYPDNWPESTPPEDRIPENRPRAMKTENNMTGSLKREEVYQRSIFSIKCDLYM